MSPIFTAPAKPVRPVWPGRPEVVTVYHGAPGGLTEFDPELLGSGAGHDQEGPGFYLTSEPQDAALYGVASKDGEILTCEVTVSGLVPTQLRAILPVVEWMIKTASELEDRLMDWGEEPRQAFRTALPNYQKDSAHDSFQSVWYDFYRGQAEKTAD